MNKPLSELLVHIKDPNEEEEATEEEETPTPVVSMQVIYFINKEMHLTGFKSCSSNFDGPRGRVDKFAVFQRS